MLRSKGAIGLLSLLLAYPTNLKAAENNDSSVDLLDLSLKDLLEVTVSSASGFDESLRDAPAAMVIISSKDIERRGYTSLDEVLLELPGFDLANTNGNGNITAYQRGYRTPMTQRTLLMIDGNR